MLHLLGVVDRVPAGFVARFNAGAVGSGGGCTSSGTPPSPAGLLRVHDDVEFEHTRAFEHALEIFGVVERFLYLGLFVISFHVLIDGRETRGKSSVLRLDRSEQGWRGRPAAS